jgi:hypothetical protein
VPFSATIPYREHARIKQHHVRKVKFERLFRSTPHALLARARVLCSLSVKPNGKVIPRSLGRVKECKSVVIACISGQARWRPKDIKRPPETSIIGQKLSNREEEMLVRAG